MKIGVLMIGSLYWDPARKAWRSSRLVDGPPQYVSVPIRYGRRSSTRGNTYTMVFSTKLEDTQEHGQAIVLPCRNALTTASDLIDEAECLWAAESNRACSNCISARWGCVALLPNPSGNLSEDILDVWAERVSGKHGYGRLRRARNECEAVDNRGILRFRWPKEIDGSELGFDALLGTATNPHIPNDDYVSAQTVAEAWKTPEGAKYRDYFTNNHANGITTFQDEEIKAWL